MAALTTRPQAVNARGVGVPGKAKGAGSTSPIQRLLRYLDDLARKGFYGKVLISFQNGKVHDVKIEQTKKLDEL